eukprot:6205753-Pleurochrysis_carterae.AAC.2
MLIAEREGIPEHELRLSADGKPLLHDGRSLAFLDGAMVTYSAYALTIPDPNTLLAGCQLALAAFIARQAFIAPYEFLINAWTRTHVGSCRAAAAWWWRRWRPA